ncbi:tetratricopeptide repeat (TPR)-like superfamily protein [Tasmannia lanceolata]|uniref:tetratricopeptide repeat (TPR)-like superfamily protein n=1 Tax=Tasmannia lanceolata TaxID=3420 RepID=UPI0040641154
MCNALPSLLFGLLHSHQTLLKTKQLHAIAIASDCSNDPFFATHILRLYASNDDLVSARHLFDKTPHRSVYLWNSIIRAYARRHDFNNAFSHFNQMLNSNKKPDNFTFACILRACSEKSDMTRAKTAHGSVVVSGLGSDSICGSTLVSVYSKFGLVDEAYRVFSGMTQPDLVSWNTMISAYGYGGLWHKGLELFSKMQNSRIRPDGFTLVGLLSCLCYPSLLEIGIGIHGLCLKNGYDASAHVGSALVSMYSRCSCLNSAYRIFSSFSKPDLVIWSALITGFSQCGECENALILFMEMNISGKRPDHILIASVLSACARLASVGPGKEIHGYTFRHGGELEVTVASALVDMYSKCGFVGLGFRVFAMMQERNVVAYNSIISGLGSHGLGHRAIKMFDEMLDKGFKPDHSTFSALLCACCHAGLAKEGKCFFKKMEHEFGVTPGTEHYVYMVKLLGMVGELEDAYNLIQTMPTYPDSGVLGALLSGCSINGNSKLSEIVAPQLFEIEPERTAYKVMLSNIYAADGKWNDVMNLRDDIREGGQRKTPGLSWIVEGNF